MALRGTARVLAGILAHPLTRDRPIPTLKRWLRWQLGSRILGTPAIVPFVNGSRLVASTGMTGITPSIYCGLHEFVDMSFALHFLRAGDLFVDIGANAGIYSVLAWTTGADVVAFEPLPASFAALRANLDVNGAHDRVQAFNLGLSSAPGTLKFIADRDTMNRVVAAGDQETAVVDVPVDTLDHALRAAPALIKLDVEGYEVDVLRGGAAWLSATTLKAIIVEINGSGVKYGKSDQEIRDILHGAGFAPFDYEPRSRRLSAGGGAAHHGNLLYVRDADFVAARLADAPPYRVLDTAI